MGLECLRGEVYLESSHLNLFLVGDHFFDFSIFVMNS